MRRTAARIDANHRAIVDLLRHAGAKVYSLAPMGKGYPDLLVGYHNVTALVEVKDGAKSPSRRRLTEDEAKWIEEWRGAPVYIVESDADALAMLETLRT